MHVDLASGRSGADTTLRTIPHRSFSEVFVTVLGREGPDLAQAVEIAFTDAACILAEKNVQVIQEKIFGLRGHKSEILKRRSLAYIDHGLDATVPCTFVEGAPIHDSGFAGLQIWGIVPNGNGVNTVSTLEISGGINARQWIGPGFRFVYIPNVSGNSPETRVCNCPTWQAEKMFEGARRALQDVDLSFAHVARTWIYLSRLLDWYGEFNRVRNGCFKQVGFGQNGMAFPASTGIQGRSGDEECFMDILAVESTGKGVLTSQAITGSRRQNSAFSYGSAFSRAMAIEIEGRTILHVSGTASINTEGKTVHFGDAEQQCLETLMNVAALLRERGGGLENICGGALYCKNPKVYDAYLSVTGSLGVPKLPLVPVLADICREELLVEIEAVAVL